MSHNKPFLLVKQLSYDNWGYTSSGRAFMTTIAFLRGINVGGRNKILMSDLKNLLESRGFTDVRTYIQSGNVLFRSDHQNPGDIIEKELKERFDMDVPVLCCTPDEIRGYLDTFPFGPEEPDPGENRTFLTLFNREPTVHPDLNKFVQPGEKLVYSGKALWIYCPHGYGKSKLTNSFMEKKWNVTATTRNLKTIKVMIRMAEEYEENGRFTADSGFS